MSKEVLPFKYMSEFGKDPLQIGYLAKKGKKYITWSHGELRLTELQSKAIYFDTEKKYINFIDNVTLDTRNARVIGNSYSTAPVWKPGVDINTVKAAFKNRG